MADKSTVTGFIAFFCLLSSAFFIASIVVAVQDGDDSCQGHDKTMSLKTWLLVTGNVLLILLTHRCQVILLLTV